MSSYAGVYIYYYDVEKERDTVAKGAQANNHSDVGMVDTIRGKVHGAVRAEGAHASTHTTPYDILTPVGSTGPWAPSPASRPGQEIRLSRLLRHHSRAGEPIRTPGPHRRREGKCCCH